MLLQLINVVYHKNASITIVFGAMVMLLLFSSCSGKKKELGDAITERDSMAVMDTRGVTTLVSDSGVTRYRINTEEWLVFDRKNPPYWAFEKGVYLEKFDSIFQVEASIKADTAYFFNKEEYEIIASGRRENYFFFQKGNTILFCGHYEGRRF